MPDTAVFSTAIRALRPDLQRRRLLAAGALLPLLAACKNPLGPDGLSLTREQLNQALATRFPMERRVLEVLTVQLSTPQVTLLPQDQRLGTALALAVRDRIFDLQARGRVALTYRLRYDPSDGSIRMSDVNVDQLELASGATALQGYLQRIGSVLAEQFFNDLSLYTLSASQRQMLGTLGQPVIEISADRLRIRLQPAS
ncbi:DUF1439 domain-containing protein [Amphibiibacter pelophylacis]|uniref:DUF1439 domain-containing protein n=1 Tax=Amphibiibacter pelophylacis TaxID=1799477 RepID=A0ACC6P0L0_9BURK